MSKRCLRFLFSSALVFSLGLPAVQAQNWTLLGNSDATAASKLGTTTNIPLNFYTNNSPRMYIDAAGKVGIGMAPVNIFSLKGVGSTPAPAWITAGSPILTTFAEGAIGNGDILTNFASDLLNARAVVLGRKSRGTLAAPTPVVNNEFLISLYGSGYDGKGFQIPAGIDIQVDGAVSPGIVPGKIIFYTGTNGSNRTERVKIGTSGNINFNNTQMAIVQATGDVSIGVGSLKFANSTQSIQFPAVGTLANPMITMLPTGTVAASRMVIAPTPGLPNYGLKFSQTNSSESTWDFIGVNGSVLKLETAKKQVTVSDSLFAPRIKSLSSGPLNGIEALNFGTGNGIYGYTKGLGGYSSSGLTGESDSTGAGVHGDAWRGAGIDGYSYYGLGLGGSSTNYWGIYAYSYNSSTYAGYMDGDLYASRLFTSSDRKLKKDIVDLSGGMDIISKLKPKTYEYRQDGAYKMMNLPAGKKFGLVAQDLEEVLPNLVKESTFDPSLIRRGNKGPVGTSEEKIDFKAVNYTELIPIMIKGMQEQNVVIEEQKAKMESKEKEILDMKSELEQLKSLLIAKGLIQEKEIAQVKVKLSNEAQLDQNIPNPPVNNSTKISYNVPGSSSKSEIVFTDLNGKKVKQVAINNTGKGVLNVDTIGLTSGTYSYSLYVDGKLIETKKMVVAGK